jgi:copper chaperone CopZ
MKGVDCMSKVTEALNSLPGVGDVRVSPADGEFTIHFNERQMSVAQLTSAVEEAGYEVDRAGPVHTHQARRRGPS